jgi:hypothetical protein
MAGSGVFSTPKEPKSLPEIESGGNRLNELVKKQVTDLHADPYADHVLYTIKTIST